MATNAWLHPWKSCLLAGGLKGGLKGGLLAPPDHRHTEGIPRRQLESINDVAAAIRWKTMHLFDIEEDRVDDVAEAEATFRAAQAARAKRVPVTGSSHAEGALNAIVNAYMGTVIKAPSSARRGTAGEIVRAHARANRKKSGFTTSAEGDMLIPTAPPPAPVTMSPARAASKQPVEVEAVLGGGAVEGVSADMEKEWRDACLKALSSANKPRGNKRLPRTASEPDLRHAREMSWGEKVRKWGVDVEVKPPGVTGRAPTVEEVMGIIEKVFSRAQKARKTILNPGALDAIFLALAVLADGSAAPGYSETSMGLRGGTGFDPEDCEEGGEGGAAGGRVGLGIKRGFAGVARRVAMATRLFRRRKDD